MSGNFEVYSDGNGERFSFRLTADDGSVIATSPIFTHLKAVVAGISAVRESAACALVVDRTNEAVAHS